MRYSSTEEFVKATHSPEANAKRKATVQRNRAKRIQFRETIDHVLKISLRKGDMAYLEDIQSIAEAENVNLDVQTALMIACVQRGLMGDMEALKFLRDTVGEKPSDKVEIDQSKTIESWAKNHKVKL